MPGGAETRHLVDDRVIRELGAGGHLVNVGRGEVVDTAALVAALTAGRLRGAALDVVENEPVVLPELLGLPNVVLTPHVGGSSPEARRALLDRALTVLDDHFAGRIPSGCIV